MRYATAGLVAVAVLAATASVTAQVVQSNTLGEGHFEIAYGSTGVGDVQGFYSGPFGVLSSSHVDSVAGLDLDVVVTGMGSSLAQIEYRLENTTATEDFPLEFMVRADPNGDGLFSSDSPTVEFPSTAPGEEADAWEADDFFVGDLDENINSGQLTSSDECGESCDLLVALQLDLGTLGPGETSVIAIGLSDNGQSLSSRFVESALFSGGTEGEPRLTLSAGLEPPGLIFRDRFETN